MRERERGSEREALPPLPLSLFLSCCCCCSSLGNVQSASLAHASTAHRLAPSSLLPLPLSSLLSPSGSPKKRVPVSRLVPAEATTTKSLSRNSFGTKTKIKEICFGARQKNVVTPLLHTDQQQLLPLLLLLLLFSLLPLLMLLLLLLSPVPRPCLEAVQLLL